MKFTKITNNKFEIEFEDEYELENFKNYLFPKKDLKAAEVMKILGVTRVTLSHYVTQGLLKVNQAFEGSKYTYDYDSVMKLKENK